MTKTPKAPINPGNTTPVMESTTPNLKAPTNQGIKSISLGTMMVERIRVKNKDRPQNLNFARAYPHKEQKSSVLAVVRIVTTMVLKNQVPNCQRVSTSI